MNPSLLVLEDDEYLRRCLIREFTDLCYDVTAFADYEGFKGAAARSFDFAILDLRIGFKKRP